MVLILEGADGPVPCLFAGHDHIGQLFLDGGVESYCGIRNQPLEDSNNAVLEGDDLVAEPVGPDSIASLE